MQPIVHQECTRIETIWNVRLCIRGRTIGEQDTRTSSHVAVINETFAHKFFRNVDPIGKHLGLGDACHSNDFEIVGIVEDAKYESAQDPAYRTFFIPLLQTANYTVPMEISMQVRSNYIHDIELLVSGHPPDLEAEVRKTQARIDPNLTVLKVVTLEEQLQRNFNQERLVSELTAFCGFLALFLACIGLYGVLAYSAVRRTNEIGIRMALGGRPRDVFCLVLRQGAALTLCGIKLGIGAAIALGRSMTTLLFGVTARDPLILIAATVSLFLVALLASYIPGRCAMHVDPMVALRYE